METRTQFLLLLLLFVSMVCCVVDSAWGNARDRRNIREEIITKDDIGKYGNYLWCPTQFVGSMCPGVVDGREWGVSGVLAENNVFSYYKCCGELNQHCCSHWRTWLISVAIAVPLLIMAAVLIFLVKYFCFANHRERYSPGSQVHRRPVPEAELTKRENYDKTHKPIINVQHS